MRYSYDNRPQTDAIVGNKYASDNDLGFKEEIKGIFESYSDQSLSVIHDLPSIINSPLSKGEFVDYLMESNSTSAVHTTEDCINDPYYGNYTDRMSQLINNNLDDIALESVMTSYAPISAYNPFFLKKFWIDNVYKDVFMSEVPPKAQISLGFVKRYAKATDGTRYPLPESLYDTTKYKEMMENAMGLPFKEDYFVGVSTIKNLDLLTSDFISGFVAKSPTLELTTELHIRQVKMVDTQTTPETHTVGVNIYFDLATRAISNGNVTYHRRDADGNIEETLTDTLIGQVDFNNGTVTIASTTGTITDINFGGRLSNRFNENGLTVTREVTKIEKVMEESGPRINSAVTIEDARYAMSSQNIDFIADNVSTMGATLAALHDGKLATYLDTTYDRELTGAISGITYNELQDFPLVQSGEFNLLPYDGFSISPQDWIAHSREYMERLIDDIKVKLRSSEMMLVLVGHPSLVRFLNEGINWVFTKDTQVSGVKLNYNFGVFTTSQDRVHIITTLRANPNDGLRLVPIPLTAELITFKDYIYNITIDRNYRNQNSPLTPNIMMTQAGNTFDIFPVQSKMIFKGRSLVSPETLQRVTP